MNRTTTKLGSIGALSAALAVLSVALAQESEPPLTTAERVVALERQLESLETRLQGRGTVAPSPLGSSDIAIVNRLEQLERSLDRLTADLQRVGRQADNALREASEARREALEAARLARDAVRVR